MLEIIGQEHLKQTFKDMKELPPLTILLGPKGSGKTLFSKYVTQLYGYAYIIINNKINDIRQMIDETVALDVPTVYYISDADNLTLQASNAMLKISEEPPKNLHIIMGLSSTENTLATIVSRAKVFRMDNYTRKHLEQYGVTDERLINCANNIGEVITYQNMDFDKAYNFTQLVYNNILKVNTGNSFKVANSLSFKADDKAGIPVELFFNMFLEVLRTQINKRDVDIRIIHDMIKFTLQAKHDVNRKGANKRLVFDMFILNIRTLRG